jgi:iron complex transport system ATP-binding protein
MAEALTVANLRVVRGGATVVQGLDFVARAGAVLAVLGPNGAGKSSILKAIAGILPFEGEIALDGVPARALSRQERARRVAYVPQQSELRSPLLVHEVVAQGRYAHEIGKVQPARAAGDAIAHALSLAEVKGLALRDFTTLSQGEKQRVLIARALATEARVLLLDEPTSALDVGHALRLYRLLRDLARDGFCVVVVLHPLEDALDWTDDALLLDRGRRVSFGPTPGVICAGPLEALYGVTLVPGGALGFRLPRANPKGGAS